MATFKKKKTIKELTLRGNEIVFSKWPFFV